MNTMMSILDELLMDLEETLDGQGYLPMYDFAWTLRGYRRGLTPEQINAISLEAYEVLMKRYPMRLAWTPWPTDIDNARPAAADTTLDFDLDPDGPVDEPLLVLIPVAPIAP